MAALPKAILFDLDDTLIRAYAQPEEAWTRLLHVFSAHLDAHDPEAITNPNGWSGVDGIFRFLPDGRSDRALAVIEIQGDRNVVVSPAPGTFTARPVN